MTDASARLDLPQGQPVSKRTAAIAVVIAALILTWPMMINRQPFLLSDTTTYIRGADGAAYRLAGLRSDWSDRFLQRFASSEAGQITRLSPAAASPSAPVVLAGRSIYYGSFLYVADRLGGLRLAALVQALLAALCVYGTLTRFSVRGPDQWLQLGLVTALLAIASPLAFFTSYLMPDLFTGLGLLAAAHLLTRRPLLTRKWTYFWIVILCWSCLVHTSNILIIGVVLAVMLLGARKRVRRKHLALIAMCLAVGVIGEAFFSWAVEHSTGQPPIRPPFIAARLIADGPGREYLHESCPRSGFSLCRYQRRFSGSSDGFLWSHNDSDGVFMAASFDQQRRMAAEENRFVWAVFRSQPWNVMNSSANAIWRQARAWGLAEFNLGAQDSAELTHKMPARVVRDQSLSLAFRGRMPVGFVEWLTAPTLLISLGFILATVVYPAGERPLRPFLVAILLGIAADIMVCGSLSTPHDRYLMRVAWLLPLGASIVAWRSYARIAGHAGSAKPPG